MSENHGTFSREWDDTFDTFDYWEVEGRLAGTGNLFSPLLRELDAHSMLSGEANAKAIFSIHHYIQKDFVSGGYLGGSAHTEVKYVGNLKGSGSIFAEIKTSVTYLIEAILRSQSNVTGKITLHFHKSGILDGSGNIKSGLSELHFIKTVLQGIGTLNAKTIAQLYLESRMDGSGDMFGSNVKLVFPDGIIKGSGDINTILSIQPSLTGSLNGGGIIDGSLGKMLITSTSLLGGGELKGSSIKLLYPNGKLVGFGNIGASSSKIIYPDALLDGSGNLVPVAAIYKSFVGKLFAEGELTGKGSGLILPVGAMLGGGEIKGIVEFHFGDLMIFDDEDVVFLEDIAIVLR
jgi:hypothetical protein